MIKLSEANLSILRDRGVIHNTEIVYKNVDFLIAENVVTGERRLLDESALTIISEEKQLLKG